MAGGTRAEYEVPTGQPLSPDSEAILAAGEEIVKSSVVVPRTYCSSMITTSLSAIGIYTALVSFVSARVSSSSLPPISELFAVPVMLLVATAVFVLGYIPIRERFSLAKLKTVQEAIDNVTSRRWWCSVIGTAILFAAIVFGVWLLFSAVGH